jgi:chromate transporter
MRLQDPQPTIWQLFRIWASIGLQSFGGGASTTFLIQRAFIEKHKWLTMEEFLHLWNLCLLTPGINLVALTVLIGKKLGGTWGIVASLAGMLLPSAAITCLLTALFKQIEHVAVVQEVLRGVVPATGGIMLVVGVNFALPLIRRGYKEGTLYLLGSSAIMIACALAVLFLKLSVIVVIVGAVLLGTLFFSSSGRDGGRPSERDGGRPSERDGGRPQGCALTMDNERVQEWEGMDCTPETGQ